jgi:hypothetical protein
MFETVTTNATFVRVGIEKGAGLGDVDGEIAARGLGVRNPRIRQQKYCRRGDDQRVQVQ